MKITKLITPFLGISALATTIAPIATSCSNTKHIWLSSIEETQKNTYGKVATYYFGLDKDTYKNDEFNIKVVGDNANDFNLNWEVSLNILKLKITYIKDVSGEGFLLVPFKLNVKHTNWAQEFELKLNVDLATTLDQFVERHEQIKNTWLTAQTHPTTFDLTVGDFVNNEGNIKTVTSESIQSNVCQVHLQDDPPAFENTYNIDSPSISEYTYLDFPTKEAKKAEILYYCELYDDVKFYAPSDGSLSLYYAGTLHDPIGIDANIKLLQTIDKNGYLICEYFFKEQLAEGEQISLTEKLFRPCNYR